MFHPAGPARLAAIAGLGLIPVAAAAEESVPAPPPPPEVPITAPATAPAPAPPGSPATPSASEASPASTTAPAIGQTNPLEGRVKELEDTVKALLQTIKELKDEKSRPADKAAVEKVVDDKLKQQKPLIGWDNGFFVNSADGNFKLRIRGLIQSNARAFIGESGRTGTDSFYLRKVRPTLEGTVYKYVDFRITPDFGGGSTTLQDAYLDFRYFKQASFRTGKFKESVSLERLQQDSDGVFIERSLAQNLAPNRDVGAMLYGELFKGTLSYYAGAFNGVNDGGSLDSDPDDDKDVAGRVFYEPFKNRRKSWAQNLGFGAGFSVGDRVNSLSGVNFRTAGMSTFFKYAGGANPTNSDGPQTRFSPGFYFFRGPLGLMGEYTTSTNDVRRGLAQDRVTNNGWFLQAHYALTGEKASYRGVVPKRDFNPRAGGLGAWEIGARYSEVNMDGDIFSGGFADPTVAAKNSREFTFGVNWYLNRALKIQLNYVRTEFGRPLNFSGGARDHEDVFLSQFQIQF